jgi:uncharacterized protein
MNDNPALVILMVFFGLYVLNLWRQDLAADRAGRPNRGPLPGATTAPLKAYVIAALGAAIILFFETWGEIRLGLSDQQSNMTILFGVYSLIAAFVEELIFRGFIVVTHRGKGLLWMGIVGASIVFAALHPFLWQWEDGVFSWTLTEKGWFSTGAVFVSSLWFYTVRFAAFNPRQSLLPCVAAHATKNLGVFVIKGTQGFVVGWW